MSDAADFLYPFIEGDERDVGTLLVDLSRSAEAKVTASAELRRTTLDNSTHEQADKDETTHCSVSSERVHDP